MKPKILGPFLMTATLLLSGAASAANGPKPALQGDAAIADHVRHEIVTYPYYGIWDAVNFQVNDGSVVLSGAVTEPWKKAAIGSSVKHIAGVTSFSDQIEVLPLSPMDNQLRVQLARAIYRDPVLSRYSIEAVPPIHIIVDHGHVTLEGVVHDQQEKEVAGLRAASTGLSFGPITNNLRIEMPTAPKKG